MSETILLIDDDSAFISELAGDVKARLGDVVRVWVPTEADGSAKEKFEEQTRDDVRLVATDSDLTKRGQTGLFGSSVVDWCQQRAIPVADFSRLFEGLPSQPDLFELRVPDAVHIDKAGQHISALYRGFVSIRNLLEPEDLRTVRSPQSVLARILGTPHMESAFGLYGMRLGPTSGALWEIVRTSSRGDDEKRKLLAYLSGHLLVNAVLRFPGPLLSLRALRAYLAVGPSESAAVQEQFAEAQYHGPFEELGPYYWLPDVDRKLEQFGAAAAQSTEPAADGESMTIGEFNRGLLELGLQRDCARQPECPRCAGKSGGFWCPFTDRTVCLQENCSVGPNSWIPQGARLCRIERDYYDEFAPILGL